VLQSAGLSIFRGGRKRALAGTPAGRVKRFFGWPSFGQFLLKTMSGHRYAPPSILISTPFSTGC
jgi:hypothetical protein